MQGESVIESGLAPGGDVADAAKEDVLGCKEHEVRVMMLAIVPIEEALEPEACVLHICILLRERGLKLDDLEAALDERVDVGNPWPTEAAGDAEVSETALVRGKRHGP